MSTATIPTTSSACSCIDILNEAIANKPHDGKIVRRATFRNPALRISYHGTSHRKDMALQPNYCPYCGIKL